ncbi:MAG: hypothetical protein ACTTID_03100 [Bacillales bacterium]
MLKRKSILLAALLATSVIGLSACNKGGNDDGGMFEQSEVPSETYHFSIVGSHYANWNPGESAKDEKLKFKKVTNEHYTFTVDKVWKSEDDNYFGFKFVQDGTWTCQYGVEDLNFEKSEVSILPKAKEEYTSDKNNRSNFEFNGTYENVVFDIYPYAYLKGENPIVMTLKK